MTELIKNTELLIERFNDNVKDDLSSKGIDNTREASNSLRVETTIQKNLVSIKSVGVDYLYYLDQGRKPGKFPPVDVIEQWVATKPVEIDPYLVGRKIAREGTEIYKDRTKGIRLTIKRQYLSREIKEKAPKWAKKDLLIQIKNRTQKIK